MKNRNKAVPAVYLLLYKDDKILVGRRCNTGYEDGHYQIPSGHAEEGEVPTEAIIRESKEEVGVDLNPEDLELVHVGYRPKHDETGDRVDFFFRPRKWSGEVVNMEPDKCDDLKWVPIKDLPENMTLHVRKGIEAIEKGVSFQEITIQMLKEAGLYLL